jgi:hypothetical protein
MNTDFGANTDEKSGGTRYSAGKPAHWWAMPLGGLRLVAQVTEYGSKKYAPLDWKIGQSYSTLIDCTFRHLVAMVTDGVYSKDEESGMYHAAHAAWNLLTLLTFMGEKRYDLDDVTQWRGVRAGSVPLPPGEVALYDVSRPPSAVPPPAASPDPEQSAVGPGDTVVMRPLRPKRLRRPDRGRRVAHGDRRVVQDRRLVNDPPPDGLFKRNSGSLRRKGERRVHRRRWHRLPKDVVRLLGGPRRETDLLNSDQ